MEKQVIFRDKQEIQEADLNNIQVFTANTIKDVVHDGIAQGNYYSGAVVSRNGETALSVAPGRLYKSGQAYLSEQVVDKSLVDVLPLVNKRILAVVGWGSEIDTDTQPRDMLVDLDNGTTEPQAVAMQRLRKMSIDFVSGNESPDPQIPAIDAANVLIATVVLSTTGVESIMMNTSAQLPNSAENRTRVRTLEAWRTETEPKISTVQTDLAALSERTTDMADQELVTDIAQDVARLKERLQLPNTYSDYSADYFGNEDHTETAHAGYNAEIKNGVLFPAQLSANANLTLFNPLEEKARKHADNLLLPAYDLVPRIQTSGQKGDLSLNTYQQQTQVMRKYTRTISQRHYGWRYNTYRVWYHRYYYRYYRYNYRYRFRYYYRTVPVRYSYVTTHTQTHYQLETVTNNYNGAIVAQTFLVSNSFWLARGGLRFTTKANSGDVHVFICETEGGKPQMEQVVTHTTIPVGDIRTGVETTFELPPVLLNGGKRYAILMVTQGSHRVATVDGNRFTQGTLFVGNDGDYFEGDITKDLMFSLYACQFKQARTEVNLQTLILAGGITDLEINTSEVVPDGTELEYEIQIAGKWYSLADGQNHLANGATDTLPLRAVFISTTDLAPALELKANAITIGKASTAMTHFSELRTLADPTNNVEVQVLLAEYDEAAGHSLVISLMDGATEVTADTISMREEEGATRMTAKFTLAAKSEYRIKLTGSRGTGQPFQVIERVDVAL